MLDRRISDYINMPVKSEPLRVLIAGAGIAGLTTAISLTRISTLPNLDIQLYEQAPGLLEIGASIALSPNVGILRIILNNWTI
jgi:salicylate hydroxylase